VARLYRFRWQIEFCFKEWKSFANLHQSDTANPHIAEGLIRANLCAAVLNASWPAPPIASIVIDNAASPSAI
jgi:IS4 transposase